MLIYFFNFEICTESKHDAFIVNNIYVPAMWKNEVAVLHVVEKNVEDSEYHISFKSRNKTNGN